jgi:hypothetical protein
MTLKLICGYCLRLLLAMNTEEFSKIDVKPTTYQTVNDMRSKNILISLHLQNYMHFF